MKTWSLLEMQCLTRSENASLNCIFLSQWISEWTEMGIQTRLQAHNPKKFIGDTIVASIELNLIRISESIGNFDGDSWTSRKRCRDDGWGTGGKGSHQQEEKEEENWREIASDDVDKPLVFNQNDGLGGGWNFKCANHYALRHRWSCGAWNDDLLLAANLDFRVACTESHSHWCRCSALCSDAKRKRHDTQTISLRATVVGHGPK